ncbi:MAG: hypothetical protein PHG85_05610 [Candidatus Altiarchaeota archaeon]|nr:hypothetical protein [Candidatus Altiarchaeota archaeon]
MQCRASPFIALLLALALLPATAFAWGVQTHEHLCGQAVAAAWGEEGAKCLHAEPAVQYDFCNGIQPYITEDAYERCINLSSRGILNPASALLTVINDTEGLKDYSDCPVREGAGAQIACGDPTYKIASEKSEQWFGMANSSGDLCRRIGFFCIGASYYSESKYKLNRVQNLEGCYGDIESEIDEKVVKNESWRTDGYCTFEGLVQRAGRKVTERHSQTFTFSGDELGQIISELSAKGKDIASRNLESAAVSSTMETYGSIAEVTSSPSKASTTLPASMTSGEQTTFAGINETSILYEETKTEGITAVNEFFDTLDGFVKMTAGEDTRGKGNVITHIFITLLAVGGFGTCLYLLVKTERDKIRQQPAQTRNAKTPGEPLK